MPENENKPSDAGRENDIPQSARARVMHGLGQDKEETAPVAVEKVGFWENFWYHHKWKTIVTAFVAFVLIVCVAQMSTQDKADVYVMYAGPGFMTANEARSVQDALKQVMTDYNGDGEKGVLIADFNYLNEAQIAEKEALALEQGVELLFDNYGNATVYEQYEMEVIAGESVMYILDPALYENVKKAGGLMPLKEALGEEPECAVDEYGVRLSETKFARYYSAMDVFPEDSILCLRRVSTMSAFKGKKKTERLHGYHLDLFRQVMAFEFPEGYSEAAEAAEAP
jgi:hypothetical protein